MENPFAIGGHGDLAVEGRRAACAPQLNSGGFQLCPIPSTRATARQVHPATALEDQRRSPSPGPAEHGLPFWMWSLSKLTEFFGARGSGRRHQTRRVCSRLREAIFNARVACQCDVLWRDFRDFGYLG